MNNQKWQIVNNFLKKYESDKCFIGAVLAGSYASGNYNENSDIDLYIITTNDNKTIERGMKKIDNHFLEYFINPVDVINKNFQEGKHNKGCLDIRMLSNSKILIDKTGEVKRLVEEAKQILKNGPEKPDSYTYQINCYMVWSRFDELDIKYKNKEDLEFNYNVFLNQVIYSYFQNKQLFLINACKIESIIKDKQFRENYNIGKELEPEFCRLLLNCLEEKDYNNRYRCAKELYTFFKNEFKDFDINNFSYKTTI